MEKNETKQSKININNFVERHLASGELIKIKSIKMYDLKENDLFYRYANRDKNLYKTLRAGKALCICKDLVNETHIFTATAEPVCLIKVSEVVK